MKNRTSATLLSIALSASAAVAAEKELLITKNYLNYPVSEAGMLTDVRLEVAGEEVVSQPTCFATGEPTYWFHLDVRPFKGKKVTLVVGKREQTVAGFDRIYQSDEFAGQDTLYRERWRPQFHFTPQYGYHGDVNGLVWSQGEYHLYYQAYPYGRKSGRMHWGHAVSSDLVHWRQLPTAMYPWGKSAAWSGSAIIDKDNVTGLKKGSNDLLLAFYTRTGRGEALAYSNDRGRTFEEYEGNPILPDEKGQDSRVIWYEPTKTWIIATFCRTPEGSGNAFYSSKNLTDWKYESMSFGYGECPELFELPLDGDKRNTRWITHGGTGDYDIGTFDGHQFTKESGPHIHAFANMKRGGFFYASQTWNNVPDGRRIQIAPCWTRGGVPEDMPFSQGMFFPVELSLRTTPDGLRMCPWPVAEIETLYDKKLEFSHLTLTAEKPFSPDLDAELFDVDLTMIPSPEAAVEITVGGAVVRYAGQRLTCIGPDNQQWHAGIKPDAAGRIGLRILKDRTTLEVFGNRGVLYMPIFALFDQDQRSVRAAVTGGTCVIERLTINTLKSIWGGLGDDGANQLPGPTPSTRTASPQ